MNNRGKPSNTRNKFRIIAGQWRSRHLAFAEVIDIRPTADRVRETLFNWLQNEIVGANCLDAFAGSGALGFEAISRGAATVISLEQSTPAAQSIQTNLNQLKCKTLTIIKTDALQWLKSSPSHTFDVVFLDPPFGRNLLQPCCSLLEENSWLSPGAFIYLESNAPLTNLALPTGWSLIKEKQAGRVFFAAYRRQT